MSHPANTILAVFAHPDDEIGVGSTLARYSDAGVRTVLACASRGEAATIYCEDCATRETLAEVRTRELACACGHLGIGELRWLDWPDGGINELPRPEAIGQIVRLIREIRPDIILTHPEHGLYPHPDHLAIWQMVREAFTLAADPAAYPDAGPAWFTARLFTRAIPQSFFDAAPAFAQYRVELNGQQLPFFATPDNQIDVTMQVSALAERRMAAWDCHRSQHNPDGAFTQMPDEARRAMAEIEHFVLAAARAPLPDGVNDDLLAGLESTPLVAAAPVDSAAFGADLTAELAAHRAFSDVCHAYLSRSPESKLVTLLHRLIDGEKVIISRLAHALRQIDEPSGSIEADPRLRGRGMRQDSTTGRFAFLRTVTAQAAARYQAKAGAVVDHDQKAVWDALAEVAQAQVALVETFHNTVGMI